MESRLQFVTHQRPDLLLCVLASDFAAHLGVEVFRACAGRLTSDGEAIPQYQYTESQLVKLGMSTCQASQFILIMKSSLNPVSSSEVILASDVRLQVSRRDARRCQALRLNLLLNCLVVHTNLQCRDTI